MRPRVDDSMTVRAYSSGGSAPSISVCSESSIERPPVGKEQVVSRQNPIFHLGGPDGRAGISYAVVAKAAPLPQHALMQDSGDQEAVGLPAAPYQSLPNLRLKGTH